MHASDESCGYLRTDRYQTVDLYYNRFRYAMRLVLPHDGNAAALFRTIEASDLTASLPFVNLDLWMPKFRFATSLDLTSCLAPLGLSQLGRRMDFGRLFLSDLPHYLSQMVQSAWIECDEFGIRVAAADAFGIASLGVKPKPVPVHIDRPFLFALRHVESELLLFLGLVQDVGP